MKLIDLHCDTFYRIKECSTVQNIIRNQLHVDLEKLRSARSYLQCFAMYSDLQANWNAGRDPWEYLLELYSLIRDEVDLSDGLLEIAHSTQEADAIHDRGHLAALLTVEDGGVIGTEMKRLDTLHKMGVRMMSLTWDYTNSLGHPNLPETRHLGLTDFGHDVIARMNELGMVIDVSHLSDKGFWEVVEQSRSPIVASHSNARTVMKHRRNLDDDMIRALAENGGVMGLNFCPYFVADLGNVLRVEDLVRHVLHIRNIGGAGVMAIGTDFDGMNGELEIRHIGEMDKLVHGLEKAGLKHGDIERLFYGNARRVLESVID